MAVAVADTTPADDMSDLTDEQAAARILDEVLDYRLIQAEALRAAAAALEAGDDRPRRLYDFRVWLRNRAAALTDVGGES